MDDYRDIIDSQRNYVRMSKCMKKICKACNTDYIDFCIREYRKPNAAQSSSPQFSNDSEYLVHT